MAIITLVKKMGDYGVIIYIAIRYGQAIDGTSMNR